MKIFGRRNFPSYSEFSQIQYTKALEGCYLSSVPGGNTYTITPGRILFVTGAGEKMIVDFPGETRPIPPILTLSPTCRIRISPTGVVSEVPFLDIESIHDFLYVGIVGSIDGGVTFSGDGNAGIIDATETNQLLGSLGNLNISSNMIQRIGNTLQFLLPAGKGRFLAYNYWESEGVRNRDTSVLLYDEVNPVPLVYVNSIGTFLTPLNNLDLDPFAFENLNTSNIESTNRASVQPIFYFPSFNLIIVQYGQITYNNINQAKQRFNPSLVVRPIGALENFIPLGYLYLDPIGTDQTDFDFEISIILRS